MPTPTVISAQSHRFIGQVRDYVINELANDKITLEKVATRLCITRGQLNRRIKGITGLTAQQYIMRLKLSQACRLLASDNEYIISEIAFMSGFNDPTGFSRAFKREFGITPTQYRNQHSGGND